ncbi:MAG: M3 family oligoendopeptidase [Christensenellales bacterium]|jgi:M3 family oligoendopeptidase
MMDKFPQLQYVRPDMEAVKQALNASIDEFLNASSYEEAREHYLRFEELDAQYSTMFTLASIRNTMDTSDAFYDGEISYIHSVMPEYRLVLKRASQALTQSPFKDAFAEEFGSIFIKKAENAQRIMSEEIAEDLVEESNLEQEYSKTVAACSVEFRGETCNFYGLLKHMQSTDRKERKEAFVAWANLYESVSEKLDDIYDQLVRIRVRMAKKLGFEDYTELAYLIKNRFDYKAKDVAAFREQVQKVIVPACERIFETQRRRLGVDKLRCYDESLVFPEGNATPIGDMEYLVNAAGEMYRDLSPQTGEFFDFMMEHELFDLVTRPNKHMGGYCTFLRAYKAPFIFSNFNGTSADVDVLTHETGHAFQAYVASRTLPIMAIRGSTSEINEIHSMAMEHFAYPYMEKFFGEKADQYLYAHLASALTVIPYLVSVDEFQHRVFEKPEMSAKERRQVWREIERKYQPWRDYDGNTFLEEGGFWMQKQHIFLYPFYYIDYALAQICAFELYGRMKKDPKLAWEDYYRLCRAGGSKGYFELLEVANLHNPFREGSVEAAVSTVINELEASPFSKV